MSVSITSDTVSNGKIYECMNEKCPVLKYHGYIRPSPFVKDYEEAKATGKPLRRIEVEKCPCCNSKGVVQ